MRPRLLEITAIGSYAGDMRIDFDALAPHGLFHIHGPTGAGKSSLLDALCFALYGSVPGRRRADGLRSHHADGTTEAKATLEFTAQDSDWRIVRTPTQWRGKRRGSGMTEQRATAALHRRSGSHWEPVASGPKEVDPIVERLIGLDARQFMQVVVLPQGEFQRALQAGADERAALLRTLFHTDRFDDYARRLGDRSAEAGEKTAGLRREVEHLERRLDAVLTSALGESDRPSPPSDAPLVDRVSTLRSRARALADRADSAAIRSEAAEQVAAAATTRLRNVQLAAATWQRRVGAERRLASLAESSSEIEAMRAELQAASLVAGLVPLADHTAALDHARRRARNQADAALERREQAWDALDAADRADLAGAPREISRAVTDRVQLLVGWRDAASHAKDARREANALDRQQQVTAAEADAAEARSLQLATELSDLTERLAVHEAESCQIEALTAQREAVAARLGALAELAAVRHEHDAAATTAAAEEHASATAQQAHLDLLKEQLDGIAGFLAAKLSGGTPCAVCGSTEHPNPAPTASTVTEDDVARAEQRARDARARASRARAVEIEHRQRVERVSALTGDGATTGDLERAHEELTERLANAESHAHGASDVRRRIEETEQERQALAMQAVSLRERAAASAERARAERARAERLTSELDAGADVATLEVRISCLSAFREADERSHRAQEEVERRSREHDEAIASLHEHLSRAGIASVDDLRAASRSPEAIDALQDAVQQWDQARALALDTLQSPEVVAVTSAPDLIGAQQASRDADAERSEALGERVTLEAARDEAHRLLTDLDSAVAVFGPASDEHAKLAALADLCAGGRSNRRRMSLERYVLASYLEEVAEAASRRLGVMTGGRYRLRHSDERVRGNAASGLGLLVNDAYTGVEREVSTLSGGETFLASLALALGLADVVQRHAGGVQIDALFIDEGFGSLDPEALDLAMAELDRLREGGRLVGVISHVPALRERIPTGIEVRRMATGSTIRVTGTDQAVAS